MKGLKLDTIIAHGAELENKKGTPVNSPIYLTATYSAESLAKYEEYCYTWKHVYSRETNPTTDQLADTLAMLEGCEKGVVTGSGMGAVTSTLLQFLKSGDHIICAEGMFSHTTLFVKECLVKFGVEVSFVDATEVKNIEKELKENTKIVYVESPLNPSLRLVDIAKIAELKAKKDFLFIVDSTFAPFPIQNPTKLGADLVVHSLTKFINGHGDAIGGAVLGKKEYIHKIEWPAMPCFTGASLSPMNAWLILRGLRTLNLRIKQHCKNALEIAEFLAINKLVKVVNYPGIKTSPDYELCQRQMSGLGGGMLSFELNLDNVEESKRKEVVAKFIDSLKVLTIATSLGEGHTLISVYNDKLIRIAVGLEDSEDLIEDLKQALDTIKEEII